MTRYRTTTLLALVSVLSISEYVARRPLQGAPPPAPAIELPLKEKSVRFAVIGDSGTGSKEQFEVGSQMERFRQAFPFEFVIMLGDNIYGSNAPADFKRKFEDPYKPLLDAGVKFYASLGNHDDPNEVFYKPFNMDGKRYYSYKHGDAEFFALDSNYMNPEQLNWLRKELSGSSARWKICYFHHPLYSDGKFHGPDLDLRTQIEPLFQEFHVDIVLSGHDHVYERFAPKHDVLYFVLGNSGELRAHNLRPSREMTKGYDLDRTFALFEVTPETVYFQAVSRTGTTVDSGSLPRRAERTAMLWNPICETNRLCLESR